MKESVGTTVPAEAGVEGLGVEAERLRAMGMLRTFTVEREAEGERLDRFLQGKIPRLSRQRIQRLIIPQLRLAGPARRSVATALKPALRVAAGETYWLWRPNSVEPDAPRNIRFLYDDGRVAAVDKPAGLPMHPSARYRRNTLTSILAEGFSQQRYFTVHRLDRETSGLVLLARDRAASAHLYRAFAGRRVAKTYLAVVHGRLEEGPLVREGRFEVALPLALEGGRLAVKMAVRSETDGGLAAHTRFIVLRRFAAHALVQCEPTTGRQHQIRAHLAAVGAPILGDKLYPDESRFLRFADHGMSPALLAELGFARQALHAWRIQFPSVDAGSPVSLEAPLPQDLEDLVERLEAGSPDR
jgi:23S rRNA pseudouridine1911/1915/1917 synthase